MIWWYIAALIAIHAVLLGVRMWWRRRKGKPIDGLDWRYARMHAEAAKPATLAKSLLVGAIAIGVPSLLLVVTGQLDVIPSPNSNWLYSIIIVTTFLLPAALLEELVLRGILFSSLQSFIGWKWTLLLTSVVFGLMHMWNPGADALTVMMVIVAGFFLGLVMLATNSLYAAWMAHFGWNFTMAALLHVPVSGLAVPKPGYSIVDSGPDWLTGGSWGPEGGVAAAVGMLSFTFYLYSRFIKGKQIVR